MIVLAQLFGYVLVSRMVAVWNIGILIKPIQAMKQGDLQRLISPVEILSVVQTPSVQYVSERLAKRVVFFGDCHIP